MIKRLLHGQARYAAPNSLLTHCGSILSAYYQFSQFNIHYFWLETYLSLVRHFFPVSGVRRAMRLLHLLRSRAVSSVMLRTLMSSFTLSIQVFRGLPFGLLPSTVQSLTVANASPSSLHITWPYYLSSSSQNIADQPQPEFLGHYSTLHVGL